MHLEYSQIIIHLISYIFEIFYLRNAGLHLEYSLRGARRLT